MFTKLNAKIVLIGIILIGFFLRFYLLGVNPPSLNWDETSIGYNAYSVLLTGKDEYGNFMPLSFRSFDDYKPPVYVYLTVPSIAVFGLNAFAVRFPAALFGTLAILVIFLLVREIFDVFPSKGRDRIALISAFFLAVSPYHLQFSRAAYEGNVGLFFLMLGTYLFLVGLRKKTMLIFSSLVFTLSAYSYHSFRLILPLYLLGLATVFYKDVFKNKSIAFISIILFILLSLPIYLSLIKGQGAEARLSMVTIFQESDALKKTQEQLLVDKKNNNFIGEVFNNRRTFFAREAIKGYLDHFNPNYLFMYGDGGLQHHATDFGLMYLWDLPFLLIGLFFLVRNMNKKIFILFFLLFLAPLPAAITSGAPHSVRAIAMMPILIIGVSCGIYYFFELLKRVKMKRFEASIEILVAILFIANFLFYLNQYYQVTPRVYGFFWQYGNKEAILDAQKLENNYDKVVMSYKYDQPYIYYLFYRKIDPAWYQSYWQEEGYRYSNRFSKKIGKYEFRNINYTEDKNLQNALIIAAPGEVNGGNRIGEIKYLDGKVAYELISTK